MLDQNQKGQSRCPFLPTHCMSLVIMAYLNKRRIR